MAFAPAPVCPTRPCHAVQVSLAKNIGQQAQAQGIACQAACKNNDVSGTKAYHTGFQCGSIRANHQMLGFGM